MFIFPRLTIYRAVHLTSYLTCYVETLRKCLPTFRMVAITSPSRSVKEWCTLQRLISVGSPLSRASKLFPPILPTLTLPRGQQHPRSFSAPRHIGCSARSYTARSDPSLFPTQKTPVLYDANSVSFRTHRSSAGRKMCD